MFIGDHLRYILDNLDAELINDLEKNNPGGLKMLCVLYSLQMQLRKEKYGNSSKHIDSYLA